MKTILLLYDGGRSPKSRLQNLAASKVTQRPSDGTPGCNCDRWGHPFPNQYLREPTGSTADSNHNAAVDFGGSKKIREGL